MVVRARELRVGELSIELCSSAQSQSFLEDSELAYSAVDVVALELDVSGLAWRP